MRFFSRLGVRTALLVALALFASATLAMAGSYTASFLTADQSGIAPNTDPNLVNAWGISYSPTGAFWISDNNTGLSTLYDGTGKPQSLVVTIPVPPGDTNPATPTGTVFNPTTDFVVTKNGKSGTAAFLFVTEDGTISGWSPSVDATNAVLAVDNSSLGINYKGIEYGNNGTANFLYVANFFDGTVDVYDKTFTKTTLSGSFIDPTLPQGYAPFDLRNINGQLYVTYAKQNATKSDAVFGPGAGLVDVFDLNGNFIKRFAKKGTLNAPWGIAIAPSNFGTFSNDILIGNLGDGRITAFDPTTGAMLGQLSKSNGMPISINGLWGLMFGNGGSGGSTNILYFTSGPSAYSHGRFGQVVAQ
jgi:uncharacterized protein (TIGR03118 family)